MSLQLTEGLREGIPLAYYEFKPIPQRGILARISSLLARITDWRLSGRREAAEQQEPFDGQTSALIAASYVPDGQERVENAINRMNQIHRAQQAEAEHIVLCMLATY